MKTQSDVTATSLIGEGIIQIRLPMTGNPLRYINGYLVAEDDGLALIDCGWKADDVFAALEAALHAHDYTLLDIKRVLITHHHFDHYGLAGTLQRSGVGALMMHERDWERAQHFAAEHHKIDELADRWIERNGFTLRDADDGFVLLADLAVPTHLIADGERIGRLEALWTPGHSPGHLCFIDATSGKMLTGDHILDPITPHVGFWNEESGDPLGDYLASLAKAGARPATGVLPAHGEPFPDLQRRVGEIIAHTYTRERQILTVLAERKRASAGEIAQCLPWTRRERGFETLEPFHQQFAVSETIAHLEHVRARGEITRAQTGATLVYCFA